jgi:hypothetical protein
MSASRFLLLTLTSALLSHSACAVSLAELAKQGPPKLFLATKGAVMPNTTDQTNNLKEGDKALLLSSRQLTDLAGISTLMVEDNGKTVPIASVKNLHVFLNHNQITAIPGEIADLDNVKFLYFEHNQLARLPRALADMDALEESGQLANTLVVLWSDHGWHLGEKLHWEKTTLWEEAAKCVLLIAAPGAGKPGQRCAAPVNLLDLYPTLVELAGLPPRPGLEGASLAPLLRDPQAVWTRPSLTTHGRGNHSVRTARWRYIRYANGEEELYDHDADPNEWRNLAREEKWAAVKRELAAALPKDEAPPINDYSHSNLPPRSRRRSKGTLASRLAVSEN